MKQRANRLTADRQVMWDQVLALRISQREHTQRRDKMERLYSGARGELQDFQRTKDIGRAQVEIGVSEIHQRAIMMDDIDRLGQGLETLRRKAKQRSSQIARA